MMEGRTLRLSYTENGGFERRQWIEDYLAGQTQMLDEMKDPEVEAVLVSEANWQQRHGYISCGEMGLRVFPGDICFMDFGKGYIREVGYQHFGLIISINGGKAFVLPMTSNKCTYAKAYDADYNPGGNKNLLALGVIEGLNKPSVLFLNDAKYINTARIIDIKAHLDVNGILFQKIIRRLKECLFS